jgi:PAS domain S-box-containing protein
VSAPSQSALQAETEARLRFEILLADVCAQFVNVAPNDLDSKIENAQRVICESLRVDHSSVWQVSKENSDLLVMTHVYRGPNLTPLPLRPSVKEYFPWSSSRILNKEVVCVPNTAKLPPEATKDKESWEQYGIHSSLVFPLSVGGGSLIGILAFDNMEVHDWSESLQRRLQILAHVFAQALELKRVEQKVRESESRFRLLADTAPVLIWQSGTDKLCTYFNKSWLDFTGRSIEEELGNGWAEGVHPDDLQKCIDTYTQSFDRREKFKMEYRLRQHDGEYRWIIDIGVPRFDQDRSFVGYIGIGFDVTDRKLAGEALRDSDDKLRLLLDSTAEAIYGIDLEDRCTFCNPACLRALRYERVDEVLGKNMHNLVHYNRADGTRFPAEECRIHRLTTGEGVHGEDEVFWRPNGTSFPVEYWSYPQRKGEEVVGAVVAFIDITERKLAEAALANVSRKLIEAQEQERTRIGRELHDDIGQRLALLAVQMQQLHENPLVLPEVRSRTGEVHRQISEIATDIQSLSHELHSAKLQYLGIAGAMRGFCREFGENQKAEIDFQTHDLPSPMAPDTALCFFRVLQEALHNSAKHSGVRHIEVRLWGTSDEIHLTVADSGAGFDREAAKESRGLGLISMEERLKLVNGTLSIDSQPKRGTTIHARAPLSSGSDSVRAAG